MLRFGIVGFGLHARKRLMPAFLQTTRARVTALSQRDIARARASAAEYNVPHAFASVEELCQCPDVDAVFVATPNVCHLRDVLTAVRCGKAVLCEKPMAMNADECRTMIDAAQTSGVLLGVAHVFRFTRMVQRMRELVRSGAIGAPLFARAEYTFPGLGHPRQWLHDRAKGGGVVNDIGVHCLDALRWILDDEVAEVQAFMSSDEHSGDVESSGSVNLRFHRGTLATIHCSMRLPYRTLLEFAGDQGRLGADNALALADPGPLVVRTTSGGHSETLDNSDAFVRMIEAFVTAVEKREAFPVPAEEGWRNQVVIDAAYESARSGESVAIQSVARVRPT